MHSSFKQVPSIFSRGVLETEIGPDPKNPLNRGVKLVEECFKVAMEPIRKYPKSAHHVANIGS